MSAGIRNLRKKDLPFAVGLTVKEGWFYTDRELELMLRLDPDGSFIYEDGEPLGFATCVTYGASGVLGHLIVSEKARGRRIGNELVDAAVNYMAGRGADSMVVIATSDAVKLYGRHGFVHRSDIACQHSRLDDSVPRIASPECNLLTEDDLGEIISIDTELFGDDRSKLIEALHKESPTRSFKVKRDGRIEGFVLARPDHIGYNLGPWTASSPGAAEALLRTAISTMGNGKLYSGSFYDNSEAIRIMNGLERINEWKTFLMIRGKRRYETKRTYGLAAFELG